MGGFQGVEGVEPLVALLHDDGSSALLPGFRERLDALAIARHALQAFPVVQETGDESGDLRSGQRRSNQPLAGGTREGRPYLTVTTQRAEERRVGPGRRHPSSAKRVGQGQ